MQRFSCILFGSSVRMVLYQVSLAEVTPSHSSTLHMQYIHPLRCETANHAISHFSFNSRIGVVKQQIMLSHIFFLVFRFIHELHTQQFGRRWGCAEWYNSVRWSSVGIVRYECNKANTMICGLFITLVYNMIYGIRSNSLAVALALTHTHTHTYWLTPFALYHRIAQDLWAAFVLMCVFKYLERYLWVFNS